MSDTEETPEAVGRFIDQAESVFHEYEEGYLDPDSALSLLGDHISELRDTYEGDADDGSD